MSCSPSNQTDVFCRAAQTRVTGLAGDSSIAFWIKKLLPEVVFLDQHNGEDRGMTHLLCNSFYE